MGSMTEPADRVYLGGSVFTAGWTTSRRLALAVSGGAISALGSDAEVREFAGPRTEIVDLAGGLLAPGFQDAHVHPMVAGLEMLRCQLDGTSSEQECLDCVAAYVASHPTQGRPPESGAARSSVTEFWVTGGGWSMESFPGGSPTRQMLDSVASDRPVALINRDHHGYWVNSRALALAGIERSTADPTFGRIERDDDGTPTGVLHESAMDLVDRIIPATSARDQMAGLLTAQEILLSLGVTAWQDAAVGDVFGLDDSLSVYLDAARTGRLVARVVGALWWDRNRGREQIPELIERRAAGSAGRFRATTVKVMQDGVAENFAAAMTGPYLDRCGCPTDNSGMSFVDPVALRDYVTRLDSEGFQVHFHALGDRAVRESLDAVESARDSNGPSDNRHHLAHLQVVHPQDIARFTALGATANIQPLWAAHSRQMDELTIPFLGAERAQWQYPFADLLGAGAAIAAGSDWPVSSPNPLEGMQVGVTRRAPDEDRAAFLPTNAMSLADVFAAYTAGSARVNHLDEITGAIVEGHRADLVVLDRDPFQYPPDEIARAKVRSTYIDGECVYSVDG